MVSTQLSLFDTASAEVGSFYKPGDLVKIRKVPAIAKHVKCGHVYKVHEVDPADGRLQFWNPFSNQWDFLLPAEVKLAIAPSDKFDSPTLAEVAVGESNLPTSESDTTTQVNTVGESSLATCGFDSPTPAESAVGESNRPPDDDCLESDAAISTYKPRGTARASDARYYRLSYKEGGKVRQIHIRGGNTDSPIAQAKVQEVRSLLASGMSPREIATMLQKLKTNTRI